jgi:hypothetical protein
VFTRCADRCRWSWLSGVFIGWVLIAAVGRVERLEVVLRWRSRSLSPRSWRRF